MEANLKDVIKIKVMCLFTKDGKTLGARGYDDFKKQEHYRIMGGGLHFGETAEEGMRREIREELKSEIEHLKLIDVIENLFTYNGKDGHDVIFLYQGELANKDLYNQETICVTEDYGEFNAEWVPVNKIVSGEVILYPAYQWDNNFKQNE